MKAGSRIRSIKPEWLDDEKLAACSDGARVLSVALIVLADDHGCGRANATWLAGIAWTYHESPDQPRKVADFLRELIDIGYIRTYTVRGQSYFEIINWRKHQRFDNAGKRRVPGPDESGSPPPAPAPAPVDATFAESRGEPPRSAAPRAPAPASLSVSDSDSDSDSGTPPKERDPAVYRIVDMRLRASFTRVIGSTPKDLTSPKWHDLAVFVLDFVDANPARRSDEVIESMMAGFKANRKATEKGWPLSYLAQNPREYLDKAPGPVSREELEAEGGTRTMTWGEATGADDGRERRVEAAGEDDDG